MPLDARLLALLCCPLCGQAVRPLPDDSGLACDGCGRVYPVVDGIPVMLVEEAKTPGGG